MVPAVPGKYPVVYVYIVSAIVSGGLSLFSPKMVVHVLLLARLMWKDCGRFHQHAV